MTDEERNDQESPEGAGADEAPATPDAELPSPEEAAATPSPEEPPATGDAPDESGGEEAPATGDAPDESGGEEAPATGDAPDESGGEEAPAARDEAPAAGDEVVAEADSDEPAAEEPAERGGGKAKPEKGDKDAAPGADLDPIAIEPEVRLSAEERARLEAEEEEKARAEAAAAADSEDEPVAAKPAKLSADQTYRATGKRKSSVARVILSKGDGKVEVNSRSLEDYFPRAYLQTVVTQPLAQTGYEGSVDVRVNVNGGGISGQASAARHGIAKALCEVNPELRATLKKRGMLTRDARVKERRKAGLKKARKRPQFSKR